jgi:hypothetical protein
MALEPNQLAALYAADPPPVESTDPAAIVRWAYNEFVKVQRFLRRPEVPGVVFTRLDSAADPDFRAQDGFMIYAGPGVLGPQEGFYVREGNAWKKVAGT